MPVVYDGIRSADAMILLIVKEKAQSWSRGGGGSRLGGEIWVGRNGRGSFLTCMLPYVKKLKMNVINAHFHDILNSISSFSICNQNNL